MALYTDLKSVIIFRPRQRFELPCFMRTVLILIAAGASSSGTSWEEVDAEKLKASSCSN